ncbi:hypothetical protein DFH09DRAFT_1133512 [Mycena vulgaris]|nr:hypothetical protein DFH09DRAFT_1133512 [Mycena vulgaris]
MRSLIAFVPLCLALLSSASPLGDRALFRKHTGAPLARRFILSSRFDAPAACAARLDPTSDGVNATIADNSTITIPDAAPDNSTLTTPAPGDNSTTVADPPVDVNATTPADNSTAVAKRYGYYDFEDAWFDLCMNSGGDIFDDSDPCFEYGINGFSALLADADVCAQQENADAMITFAKSRGVMNTADLIEVAVAYRRLARESVEIMGFYPSTPYCVQSPINLELRGVWNEQPEGVTFYLFGGPSYPIVTFGDDVSCPYGQTPDVTTCSCVGNFYGNTTDTSSTETVEATPSDIPTSSDAAEPSSTEVVSDSAEPPVETSEAATDDAASSTSAAPVAAATEISGDINDPNGRR